MYDRRVVNTLEGNHTFFERSMLLKLFYKTIEEY
jgi:hypothetical protein